MRKKESLLDLNTENLFTDCIVQSAFCDVLHRNHFGSNLTEQGNILFSLRRVILEVLIKSQ